MRQTWIFQANPKRFDIDGYLATRPDVISWLVTRYRAEIAPGDHVYLWRAVGNGNSDAAGIIAAATVAAETTHRHDTPDAEPFWKERADVDRLEDRALLRMERIASPREVLQRRWLVEDPILRDLTILKMANATNYRVPPEHEARLAALWERTGRNWTRAESIAGLWAYHQTYQREVSRLPESPVARIAVLIGRAVSGVYNKVMNFRSLDPRETRAGMTGAGTTDKAVWEEFFDPAADRLDEGRLEAEFQRLWGDAEDQPPRETEVVSEALQAEAERLARLPLSSLLARYNARLPAWPRKPRSSTTAVRTYQRDPLVIAIAKVRAEFRCEIPECSHPVFFDTSEARYCEVHHIRPLADGGEDTLENVACVCPSHHAEAHHGKRGSELAAILCGVRAGPARR